MIFTDAELAYLRSDRLLGRLATVDPKGAPQNSPVGYTVDPESGAIDIGGYTMGETRKYRNAQLNSHVSLVVDDIASRDPWQVRGVEIRGEAETLTVERPAGHHLSGEIIRIHPTWIHSWGLDPDTPYGGSRRVDRAVSGDTA